MHIFWFQILQKLLKIKTFKEQYVLLCRKFIQLKKNERNREPYNCRQGGGGVERPTSYSPFSQKIFRVTFHIVNTYLHQNSLNAQYGYSPLLLLCSLWRDCICKNWPSFCKPYISSQIIPLLISMQN